MKNKYCGVVVLFNPEIDVVENIKTYVNEIERLFVINNSTVQINDVVNKLNGFDNIQIIMMNGNIGLAMALSLGCEMALSEKFDYILTMDQDSSFENGSVKKLKEMAERLSDTDNCAIIAPNVYSLFKDKYGKDFQEMLYDFKEPIKNFKWVMTSGSLMNLKAYCAAGCFDKSLFIDHIDIDIGMKFKKCNYKIIRVNNAYIYQHLGNSQPRKFLWKTVHPLFASPLRTYYVVRNQMYLTQKYGREFLSFSNVSYLKIIIKIMLYEPQKIKHLHLFIKAIGDAKKGKMGEYSH